MKTPSPTPEVDRHVAVAACAARASVGVAIAPCFFQLDAAAADHDQVVLQVTPAGEFLPRDERPMKVKSWRIDGALARAVIAHFNGLKTPLVVDYEHQTMLADTNGQPAPAAGFIRALEWREGVGLFARVELTARARRYIADGEYRYFSPVFAFDERTGDVRRLLMGALTNNPALDGMAPIELAAAARFSLQEESEMKNKLLLALCAALNIKHDGREAAEVEGEAIAALSALQADPLADVRTALGAAEDAGAADLAAACASLKAKAEKAGKTATPDPSKYVEVEVVNALRDQVATLTAQHNAREIDELVKPALEDGRLLPAQEKWARGLGAKDIASLKAYLDDATPIAALRGTQTQGQQPVAGNEHGLSADEVAVCKASGISEADYAKSKKATA